MIKVGIVGMGEVGEIVAYTAAMKGLVDEIILNDIKTNRAMGELKDLEDGSSFYPHNVKFSVGEAKELADAGIILISLGKIPEDLDRLKEFEMNKEAISEVIPEIMKNGFDGVFVVVTNPVDIITHHVQKISGLDKGRVIGSGTFLDSQRATVIIANKLGVSTKAVKAMMLGEHGNSQFLAFSNIQVGGISIKDYLEKNNIEMDKNEIEKEVIRRGSEIFIGKNSTQYGIANTTTEIIRSIIHDENACYPVSTLLEGQYGIEGIHISTPAIIGKDGIKEIIELKLSDEELYKYRKSAEIIKKYVEML